MSGSWPACRCSWERMPIEHHTGERRQRPGEDDYAGVAPLARRQRRAFHDSRCIRARVQLCRAQVGASRSAPMALGDRPRRSTRGSAVEPRANPGSSQCDGDSAGRAAGAHDAPRWDRGARGGDCGVEATRFIGAAIAQCPGRWRGGGHAAVAHLVGGGIHGARRSARRPGRAAFRRARAPGVDARPGLGESKVRADAMADRRCGFVVELRLSDRPVHRAQRLS